MKAFEFQTQVSANNTLSVPDEVIAQLDAARSVRVILLVPDSPETAAWGDLTAAQFLKGYADSDAIYDRLHNGG